MDTDRFDTLTRHVGSRRGILAAALGGIPLLGFLADATAKKRRRKKHCARIKYRLRPDTCPTIRTNTCGGKKRVRCQTGKTCLGNKSCGLNCASSDDCPAESGCTCSMSEPKVCLAAFTNCDGVPTTCATTADCPIYAVCEDTDCGEEGATEKRCLPLCGHAPEPSIPG
jgi:hypothetical protein